MEIQKKTWFWPLCLFILLVITFLAFVRSFQFQFIDWDDNIYIVYNPLIKNLSWSNFMHFFQFDHYISLSLLSFTIDYHFFGLNPGKFHMVNLFIHLINVMLVYILARKLNIEPLGALVTAALFALHPMRVETVCWVMQRKDLLYSLFFILGMLTYVIYVQKGSRNFLLLILVLLCGYLSLLSKIQAFTFPIALFLVDYYLKRKIDFKNIFEKAMMYFFFFFNMFSVVQSLWFLLIFYIFFIHDSYGFVKTVPFFRRKENNDVKNVSLKQLFISDHWMLLLIIPVIFYYVFPGIFIQRHNWWVYSLIPVFFITGRLIEKFIFRKSWKNLPRSVLLIFITLVSIILIAFTLNALKGQLGLSENVPIQESSFINRGLLATYSLSYYIIRFFIPFNLDNVIIYPVINGGKFPVIYYISLLLPLLIVIFLAVFRKKLRVYRSIIIFCLLFFLLNIFLVLHFIPIKGEVVVANRYTYLPYLGMFLLLGYFITRVQKKIKLNFKLAILALVAVLLCIYNYNISDTWKNSEAFWNDALAKNPKNHYAWFSIGNVYRVQNKPVKAMKAYEHAISLSHTFAEPYNNLGRLKVDNHDLDGALKDFDNAIKYKSNFADAYTSRSMIRIIKGDYQKAIIDLNEAIKLTPNVSDLYFSRGNAYTLSKNFRSALPDYDKAISIADNPFYFSNRALVKIFLNDLKGAEKDIENSLQLKPDHAMAIYNRGIIKIRSNDTIQGKLDLQKAISFNPGILDFYKQFGLDNLINP